MTTASVVIRRARSLVRRGQKVDATAHLLATPANRAHLMRGLAEFERGKAVTHPID